MYQYPKQILTIAQQIQSYIDAGMVITSREDVEIGVAVKKGNKELVDAMNKVLGNMTDADFSKIMDEAIKKQPLAK